MDSNYIQSDLICDKLVDIWCESNINHYYDFMKHLDIGIVPVGCDKVITGEYKIINEKKWLLAKLKYGL
jgi:hypothetical protein